MKEKTLVHIPTSDRNGWPGEVKVNGEFPSFRLRCTVSGCGWKRGARSYAEGQSLAFVYAGPHRS